MDNCLSRLLTTAFVLFSFSLSHAQIADSVFTTYQNQFPQEKIYLQYDRAVYSPGDTIWFKAYIRAGLDASDFSKSFYADWYDENGLLVMHTSMPIYESAAKGQLAIPAGYKGHLLQVKAYTKWMLNFDPGFIYEHELAVLQPNMAKVFSDKDLAPDLSFYPEGGDLVNGLSSVVAFRAIAKNGAGINIKGIVKNSRNEAVTAFSSQHDGMGSLSFKPAANEIYTAYWQDEAGKTYETALPASQNQGIVMQVDRDAGNLVITIKKQENAPENLQTINLLAHINQHLIAKTTRHIGAKIVERISIPTTNLPTGILQLTVFDAGWKPLAERISFVNNHEYSFAPAITLQSTPQGKGAKEVIEIAVHDSAVSNLSVAVTDGNLTADTTQNIFTQLLLCGDLKGHIHNPAWYFSSKEDSVADALDLVMLTHGWRRFNWANVANNTLPQLTYPKDTDYLQLRGKATGVGNGNKPGEKVILLMQARDSSKQMLQLPIRADGNFAQNGLIFFDTIRVFYSFTSKSWTRRADVKLNNGLLPAFYKRTDAAKGYIWSSIDQNSLQQDISFEEERKKVLAYENTHDLKGVTIKSKAKKPVDMLDETYASGMFTGDDGPRFDILNDTRAQSFGDIFSYLQGQVAGLQIDMKDGSYSVRWRSAKTALFLDQIHTDAERLMGTPMADIAYIKIFRPPFYGETGGGSGGAIAVYTRKGADVNSRPGSGLPFVLMGGYTSYRQFYNPKYDPETAPATNDVRATVFWNPYLFTDVNNPKATISFYKDQPGKRLQMTIEGVLSDGRLVHTVRIIN